MRASSWFAIGGLAAMAACGHAGDQGVSVSGTDLSCGSHTYIANGQCLDLPPFSDASLPPDAGDASPDAGDAPDDSEASIGDIPSDAGVDEPAVVDLLAPCASTSNVFFVEAVYMLNGPAVRTTYRNMDTTFDAAAPPPLQITVTPPSDFPTILALTVFDDGGALAVPNPGTYQTGTPGVTLNVTLGVIGVTFDQGAVTIEDVQVDPGDEGGPARLHSLLLAYDLFNPAGQKARGCLRYFGSQAEP